MNKDFKKLIESEHMLKWFSNNPFEEIISTITDMFIKQSPSTKMLNFEIANEPEWLSGGKETEDNKMILVRSGMAVTCEFTLQDNNGTYNLNGILTWVGVNLDTNPKTNIWMDLDGNIEDFGKNGLLKSRIYELDNL